MTKKDTRLVAHASTRLPLLFQRKYLAGLTLVAALQSLGAADLTWSGGPNNLWNTTSANWNGNTTVWNNAVPDNAIFSTQPPYLVLLSGDIVAGTITASAPLVGLFSAGGSPDATLNFSKITAIEPGNPWYSVSMGGMEFNLVGSSGVKGRIFVGDECRSHADKNWSAWVIGNGLFGKVTNVSQVPNYNFNSGDFLVDADDSWSESFVIGLYTGC